jgi:SAM-dependent methyltransferase
MNNQGRFIFDERPAKDKELDRLIKLNSFYHLYTKNILDNIKKNTKIEIKSIIDIGAGTGHTTILLKKLFPDAKVTYFDLSQDLLIYSKELSQHSNIQIEFIKGDILSHKFEIKYDLVFSRFALKHIFNPQNAINIMCNSLSDKGIVCLIDKDVYANIWFPRFPLYKTKFMDALNKYNKFANRGGDSAIGRKIRYYLSNNDIEVQHEELLSFNLNDNSEKNIKVYKEIYIDVYKNLVPELVDNNLITTNEANKDINKLIGFLENKKNTAIIVDFGIWGRKNG